MKIEKIGVKPMEDSLDQDNEEVFLKKDPIYNVKDLADNAKR